MNDNNSLYQEAIKQFAKAAHGHGQLQHATGAAQLDNPLCGDRVAMQVAVTSGHIAAVAHASKGCLLCRAAAAVIGLRAVGQSEAGIASVTEALERMLKSGEPLPAVWPELAMFEPARAHASRHRCILLPFRALLAALQSAPSSAAADRPAVP
ncbi:MAG: iron-sulfur cluster assembly scaffold protein [Betaproteobacteria bacterium]|nr:iron-sulfur cluster assembly scaffold protein [Rhodocyclales bacterium]